MMAVNDIFGMLKNLNRNQINEAVKKAQQFAQTPQGKAAIEKLKRGEAIDSLPVAGDKQNEIISALKNNPEAAKKIAELLGGKG